MGQETLVTFLLDRSESMNNRKPQTISGFNAFVAEMAKEPSIKLTLIQFDDISTDVVFSGRPISEAPYLSDETFEPRGATPLIDACYKTIKAVEASLESYPGDHKIIIVFQTDGMENRSKEHSWEELASLVEKKKSLGWNFNFMGASMDAYGQAGMMGIDAASTISYASTDWLASNAAFAGTASNNVNVARRLKADTRYSEEQKRAAGDAHAQPQGHEWVAVHPIHWTFSTMPSGAGNSIQEVVVHRKPTPMEERLQKSMETEFSTEAFYTKGPKTKAKPKFTSPKWWDDPKRKR